MTTPGAGLVALGAANDLFEVLVLSPRSSSLVDGDSKPGPNDDAGELGDLGEVGVGVGAVANPSRG